MSERGTGLGRRMMTAAGRSRARRVLQARPGVERRRKPAQRFYESLGFERYGTASAWIPPFIRDEETTA